MAKIENVIVLGASAKSDRYSYKALTMLSKHGHKVVGVHPRLESVNEIPVFPSLKAAAKHFEGRVDTVTLYLSPERLHPVLPDLLAVSPHRVIMNPGTESSEIEQALKQKGIITIEACTLVLLSTGQF